MFQIGDVVEALPSAGYRYSITTPGTKWPVIGIENELIVLRDEARNDTYKVLAEHFKLVKRNEGNMATKKTVDYKIGDTVDLSQALISFPKDSKAKGVGLNVGDLVVYVGTEYDYFANRGDVLAFAEDDGSRNPLFKRADGETNYIRVDNFAPVPQGKVKKEKPAVVSTMTVYSDGVKVGNTELQFDGETWSREKLQATVKRYQEMLRRPVATVAEPAKAKRSKKSVAKKPKA